MLRRLPSLLTTGLLSAALPLAAQEGMAPEPPPAVEPEVLLSAGDTAWMLTATALVLLMTLPGLALFYGGLVRAKNVLSLLVQCFGLAGIMTILWVICGYTLAFGTGGPVPAIFGNFEQLLLRGITGDSLWGSIPEAVFVTFQMTFFIITPALICGAYAERMKFSAMVLFSILWGLLCYLPICHMAWASDGWFHGFGPDGVLDFAGGTVVHINAGVAALVAAIILGKRTGYPQEPMKPHNLTMTVTGAALLWVGWFGFNAGSQLAADGTAGMAMLVTQVSAACGAVTWMAIEWLKHGKPSALGLVSGAVGGLVGITPAAGTVGIPGALVIGVLCGIGCYWGAVSLKRMLKYDDSLDAFGVHGIGGIIGAVLTGVFADLSMGGSKELSSIGLQVWAQVKSILVTLVWSGALSAIILIVIDKTLGLRVSVEDEQLGLDLTQHEERGYII